MSSSADFSRPSPEDGCYDVFLSFRGTDTRNSFTNHLYHSLIGEGVCTFMDVDLLGEEIDYLFKIIDISRMAVVIYSENFALSDWCLRELEMILQLKKEKKILVIPIFFKVEVSELKQLTGKTGKYLDQHIPKHGETIVKNWKVAVTSFGNVSGLSYKDSQDRSEYEFIKLVIDKINKKLLDCKEAPESFKPNSKHVQTRDSKMKKKAQMEKGSTSQQNIEISRIPQLRQEHRDSSTFSRTSAGQEGYSIITTGYFQKLEELNGNLLNIKPSSVNFLVERGKPSCTCILLSNKTNSTVAFTVKASQPLKYCVHQNYKGLLPPRSSCQVIVTLLAQSVFPPNMNCSDMFTVESVKVKNDSYPSTDDISRMLTREPGNSNTIDKYWLNVFCGAPLPELVSSVPSPDHLAQLHNKGFVHGAHLVISIDVHQTKPWLLLIMEHGIVCIWNHKTRTEEKSLQVVDSYWNSAKFMHEKHWIVVGTHNGFVHVFDYNTWEKVKEFKAHESSIICVAVHPTSPCVFTTSSDKLIKLWNWKNNWACSDTFYGHSDCVMEVAFNPKVSRSFASVSWDGTIKIWSLGSSAPKITLKASINKELMRHVEYFVGSDDKLYLLSTDDSYDTVKVWDYESQKIVETLKGHTNKVMATLVHPKLPIIITGSLDKTIRIWNKNTHRLVLVWNCDLGTIWSIKYIKASDEVVLGCEDGIIVIKIVNAGTRSD